MDQGPLGSQHRGARPPLLFPDCGWQETARAPAPGMEFLFPSARPFSGGDPCLIGKHLCLNGWKGLGSLRPRRIEIVSELASHLEDCYEECRTHGVGKSEAIERSLEQVASWPNLSRKIRGAKRKEEMMNHRTRTLWLPALISLAAAMFFLMISTQIALEPRVIAERFIIFHTSTTSTSYSFAAYLPWLILLPFCGAAGAYLSRRAGGQRPVRLLAGLFPGIALFGLVSFLTLI